MALEMKDLLLREAETLMRTRGYAAFSYADLSERVGIRKASIHHHFPTKEALGVALVDTYLEKFERELESLLASEQEAEKRLARYAEFFIASMRNGLMPLCGALSAEIFVLPEPLQNRVRDFFGVHIDWLSRVVEDGIGAGELRSDLDVKQTAALILSTLEGSCLVAWATKNTALIRPAIRQVVESLKT
jgi:TetR/AcrR family transcriptional repressor of nem operon